MLISMAGINYKTAPVELREALAFDHGSVKKLCTKMMHESDVNACALISTCNRTELYISGNADAEELLLKYCTVEKEKLKDHIIRKNDMAAVKYLCEVACGLHSAILCEEQITSQVGDAIELSRDADCADPILNTMFRCAVTAGKYALTNFKVRSVPLSAAEAAVRYAENIYGTLNNRRALIIGNGVMGRLAAETVIGSGGKACITLRRYKHGENIIPNGAEKIEYADRYSEMKECDFVISATRSPHYTITEENLRAANVYPDMIFDIAVPRDVEPSVGKYTRLINVDDLCDTDPVNESEIEKIKQAANKYAEEFEKWLNYKTELSI